MWNTLVKIGIFMWSLIHSIDNDEMEVNDVFDSEWNKA